MVLALVAVWAATLLPSYTAVATDSNGNESATNPTLLAVNGMWVLLLVMIPVVATAAPLFAAGRGWQVASIAGTALLGLFVLASALSIGVYFLPALIPALIAVFLTPRRVGRGR